MRIRSIITSLLAVVVTIGADAGTKVRNYSIKDGLNDSSPRCLIQDSKGLLWIGSWNGVNTFDGGSFSLINGYDGEPFGATRNIAETEEGLIWICNHDGISRISLRCRDQLGYMLSSPGDRRDGSFQHLWREHY